MAGNGAKSGQQAAPKPSKKKGAKVAERAVSPSPLSSPAPEKTESQEDSSEHPLIREVQKSIRNVNKKLTNASKTDALVNQHSDKSLDELVAARIINADQKAQILKKPGLQAQLNQLEEQLKQLKKVDADNRARLAAEKAELEKSLKPKVERELEEDLKKKFEAEKAAAVAAAVASAVAEKEKEFEAASEKKLHDSFLTLSQVLLLAAARRAEQADQTVDENQALEGVLLALYGGNDVAAKAMMKLAAGAEEPATNLGGEPVQTTYAQLKDAAVAFKLRETEAAELVEPEEPEGPDDDDKAEEFGQLNSHSVDLAAFDDVKDTPARDDEASSVETALTVEGSAPTGIVFRPTPEYLAASNGVPPTSEVANEGDAQNEMSTSQEWVSIEKEPTETGVSVETETTPAALATKPSWADDHPEPTEPAQPAPAPVPAADPNDGFQSVQRKQPRGDKADRGNWRGRGGHQWRGRGRGEGRGRGRGGGSRGDMVHRGPRRDEN